MKEGGRKEGRKERRKEGQAKLDVGSMKFFTLPCTFTFLYACNILLEIEIR